jgi:DNA-binding transcriptional LysR family regulator
MNTRFLETFVWLNRLGSFSRTAEKLNTTQPAVSGRIQKLEEELGAELYERSTKTFALTSAGRRILHHAESMLALQSEMELLVSSDQDVDGPLRIGIVELVTLSWLPRFLERIREVTPSAVLEIDTGITRPLVHDLKEGRFDIIFVLGPIDEPHIENQPICSMGMHWLANPTSFDCSRTIDVMELSRLPVMMLRKNGVSNTLVREYFARYGVVSVPSRAGTIRLDCAYSAATAIHVVRSGLGITALPIFLFDREIRAGEVAMLPVRQRLSPMHITACYRQPVTHPLVKTIAEIALKAAADFAGQCDPEHFWT